MPRSFHVGNMGRLQRFAERLSLRSDGRRISARTRSGQRANSYAPSISANGNRDRFQSDANNLVAEGTSGVSDSSTARPTDAGGALVAFDTYSGQQGLAGPRRRAFAERLHLGQRQLRGILSSASNLIDATPTVSDSSVADAASISQPTDASA